VDYEAIINVYKVAYKRALASNDNRAQAYGERLTHWIQVWEQNHEDLRNALVDALDDTEIDAEYDR
jgi:hypothetical protein